jgi:hypothetical protein
MQIPLRFLLVTDTVMEIKAVPAPLPAREAQRAWTARKSGCC